MTESVNGPTPVSESVNRVEEIIKHPDEDQVSPESFRLDQSDLDVPVAKTVLTAVPVRRPAPLEWVRVHPDPNYRVGPVPFVHLAQTREFYLVDPPLRPQLRPREYWIGEVFLAINRLEHPFFWIVTLQSPTGRSSDWYTSAYECASIARDRWVQVVADQSAGCYQAAVAEEVLEEPTWPKQSFHELFQIGFKRRTVESLDHPVLKQLRGRM